MTNHLAWTLTCLLTASAFLAPAAVAGHVQLDFDPCRDGFGELVGPLPACRGREANPCASYGEWERDGTCPAEGDLSCLAYGLYASLQYGLVNAANGHSAATLRSAGSASSDASQQEASVAGVAREGTLTSTCDLRQEEWCYAEATAAAADLDLLGGAIRVGALESRAAFDCWTGQTTTETRFTRLEIGGYDYGPIVHAGTRVVIPGVAIVTIGDEATPYGTPWGGIGVHATALRIETMDAFGNPTGVILVGHSAVAWR